MTTRVAGRSVAAPVERKLEDGRWTCWHDNGRRKSEGALKDGKREGRWKTWHANGRRRGDGEYERGIQTGRWTFWWENGRKRSAGMYENGRQDGRWFFWGADGRRTAHEFVFAGGRLARVDETRIAGRRVGGN
jgi:antitoxin component YwqK of YwqJK toxin-antitoxin module